MFGMALREANPDKLGAPVGMLSAKVERLLVERLLEARALPTAPIVAVPEPRLAESAKASPEVRDRAIRERELTSDLGKRLARSMASDDLFADRLGNGGGHGVPPGDQSLQGPYCLLHTTSRL